MDLNKLTFRFDDICCNSNLNEANDIAYLLRERFPFCIIIYGISPLVTDMSEYPNDNQQRVFPNIFKAHSSLTTFYQVNKCGIPEVPDFVEIAAHGICHVDHRLLSKECQEMSILLSCNLTRTYRFIPPFNKWNKDTEEVCDKHRIQLIKWEEGWKSMEYNAYDEDYVLWYLHHREWTLDKVRSWIG